MKVKAPLICQKCLTAHRTAMLFCF